MAEEKQRSPYRTLIIVAVVALFVVLGGAAVVAALWIPTEQRRIIDANEARALSTLRDIAVGQEVAMSSAGRFATLPELHEAKVVSGTVEGETVISSGYVFTLKVVPGADGQPPAYTVNADPQPRTGYFENGQRHFYLDSRITGIRVNPDRPATAADRPIT